MAWHYLPDTVASKSDYKSGCDPSDTSKSMSTQLEFFDQELEGANSTTRQSGTMSAHSAEKISLAEWTLLRSVSLARISARRAMARAWKASEARYFSRVCGWPRKRDPNGYSLKMSEPSGHAGCDALQENWPHAGMIVDGILYPLRRWEPAKGATDGGVWPAITVLGNHNRAGYNGKSGDGTTTAAQKLWSALTAAAATQGENVPDGRRSQTIIEQARRTFWASLLASDGAKGSGGGGRNHIKVPRQAMTLWSALTSRDYKSVRGGNSPNLSPCRPLSEQVGLFGDMYLPHLAPTISKDGPHILLPSQVLSPWFGEALMGLPIGWTELDALEMEFIRTKRRQRSTSS